MNREELIEKLENVDVDCQCDDKDKTCENCHAIHSIDIFTEFIEAVKNPYEKEIKTPRTKQSDELQLTHIGRMLPQHTLNYNCFESDREIILKKLKGEE
jgi:hypothetical protein